MKAFVTGGTGFIGRHVVRKLLLRGHDVVALVRSQADADALSALGARPVVGDITDPTSMRQAMAGSDVLFHIAGWYRIGTPDRMDAERINVSGTRNVLSLAHELGVPRIVYASSVAVYGDTRGRLVDESFFQGGPFATEYDRTKWLAHYKVVLPLIRQGAPIIVVLPGGVYGPGDHSLVGRLMALFYQGRLPVLPAPEFTMTYAHVEDMAEGIILAAEKGRVGQSYNLAGPAIPLGEIVDFWSQLTGLPAPALRIPYRLVRLAAPLMGAVGAVAAVPEMVSREAIGVLGVSYMAHSDKARQELGWRNRSLQTGMKDTFRWLAETAAPRPPAEVVEQRRQAAAVALLAAAVGLVAWLLARSRRAGPRTE
jgi:nucleoside-diphosphate-sugar epimerase